MRTHELKTWPSVFNAVASHAKTHEVRKNDRDYAVGDVLYMREWDPDKYQMARTCKEESAYTGRWIKASITYITPGGSFGLPVDLCVMSIVIIEGLQ